MVFLMEGKKNVELSQHLHEWNEKSQIPRIQVCLYVVYKSVYMFLSTFPHYFYEYYLTTTYYIKSSAANQN